MKKNKAKLNPIALALVIIGALLLIFGVLIKVTDKRPGVKLYTTGLVSNINDDYVEESNTFDHNVTIGFTDREGVFRTGRLFDAPDDLRIGQKIEIYYMRDEPSLIGMRENNGTVALFVIGGLSLAAGVAVSILKKPDEEQ